MAPPPGDAERRVGERAQPGQDAACKRVRAIEGVARGQIAQQPGERSVDGVAIGQAACVGQKRLRPGGQVLRAAEKGSLGRP
ncbi:MAG: hypothetical protein U5L06_04995 [Rhodovibrio sp.]|nr:hypothetical protein [Rhodovibrio sp.]